MAHREPRALPVAPGGPSIGRSTCSGRDLAEVPERVLERALLGRHLRGDVQVLHRAAAADAEVRATRHDPLRALPAQGDQRRLLPVALAPADRDLHLLAGERVLDEHHLALGVVRHALRLEVERLDAKPLVHARHGFGLSGAGRPLLNCPSPGECSLGEPPKAQMGPAVRSNAQAPRTGKRSRKQAFLAGERPVSSGSTEGASGVVRGAANLSGRADSKGK